MELQLLLAHADDSTPILDSPLPLSSTSDEPRPESFPPPTHLSDPGGDPNSLPDQRWGVVAPEGEAGDRLLEVLKPLREARARQQGAEPVTYRVPPRMDRPEAIAWMRGTFQRGSSERDRPRFLLFLGDLDVVSLDLQQIMSGDSFTGRLAFPREEDYAAYVNKVLEWERKPSAAQKASALFYAVDDETQATMLGRQSLVQPGIKICQTNKDLGGFPAQEITGFSERHRGSADRLLEEAARAESSLLFTLSHGAGAPRGGWGSVDTQRALQGAMCLGEGHRLVAEDLRERAFLPGGVWFYFACFGAGTPSRSAYYHWLHRLREDNVFHERLAPILASLPREGERPFIARLPQAALANPKGPLAVIGHVDLAWTYSFQDEDGRSRPSKFVSVWRTLVGGRRVGVGAHSLMRFAAETDVELNTLYDMAEEARVLKRSPPRERTHVGHLWMLRHDLVGYMLLGDPAVRLPLARSEAELRPARLTAADAHAVLGLPAPAPASPAKPATLAAMERAVQELLAGDIAPRNIAERNGISLGVLREWEQVYTSAGREALRKLMSQV